MPNSFTIFWLTLAAASVRGSCVLPRGASTATSATPSAARTFQERIRLRIMVVSSQGALARVALLFQVVVRDREGAVMPVAVIDLHLVRQLSAVDRAVIGEVNFARILVEFLLPQLETEEFLVGAREEPLGLVAGELGVE